MLFCVIFVCDEICIKHSQIHLDYSSISIESLQCLASTSSRMSCFCVCIRVCVWVLHLTGKYFNSFSFIYLFPMDMVLFFLFVCLLFGAGMVLFLSWLNQFNSPLYTDEWNVSSNYTQSKSIVLWKIRLNTLWMGCLHFGYAQCAPIYSCNYMCSHT